MRLVRRIKMKLRILKTAVGATAAIYLAEAFNLQFSLAAGVIAMLSLGPTKKSSLSMAMVRLKATALALGLGSLSFYAFGFSPLAFGAYLMVFLPLAHKFSLGDGIVVNSVLVTHLLSVGSIGLYIQVNSLALMAIGAGIAILLNSMMPNMMPQIRQDQETIESRFKDMLMFLAAKIRHSSCGVNEQSLFEEVGQLLEAAKKRADQNQENYLIRDFAYYSKYMSMRFLQFEAFLRMDKILNELHMTVLQSDLIAGITEEMAQDLHEHNDGEALLEKVGQVLGVCRDMELPKTREEFENRALLFSYLGELRHFIEVKREFMRHGSRI